MLPKLIPVTEIKRKATEIIENLQREKWPLLITEHGREAAILMDVTSYRLQERQIELLKGIIQGQQAISERRILTHEEVQDRERGLTVAWSEPASKQYLERLHCISDCSPEAAKTLRQKVDSSLRALEKSPEMGRWAPEFSPGFYREILVNPLRILSENHDRNIVITHVYGQEDGLGPDTFPNDD